MNWDYIPLKRLSVFGPQYGANAKAVEPTDDGHRYVRITDIDDKGQLQPGGLKHADLEDFSQYILEEGDLLFARSGATVGKTYLYRKEAGPCIFAGYLIRFHLNTGVALPTYVYHYTHSPAYLNWVESKKRVAAQPNINGVEYGSLSIPVPPLFEQQRIVEILDQADALRKKRAEADAKAERILPALFYKMFGDPFSLMLEKESIPLGQLGLNLQNGFACGQKNVKDGVPHLRMNNIDDAGVLNVDLIRTVPTEKDEERYRLQAGDVLFMGTNSEDKIGKTCVFFPPDDRHYLFSNHLIRVRISDDRILPEYLATYLHLLWKKHFYPSIAKRWVNQASVAQAALAKVRVPVHSKQALNQFKNAFHGLLQSRNRRSQSTKRLEDIFATLLYRAFTGDLTAAWREAHMNELLAEMELQTRHLKLTKTCKE